MTANPNLAADQKSLCKQGASIDDNALTGNNCCQNTQCTQLIEVTQAANNIVSDRHSWPEKTCS